MTVQRHGAAAALLLSALAVALACEWRPAPRMPRDDRPALPAAAPAVPPPTADINASRNNAIVQAIQKAAPAVVSINVVQIQRQRVLDPFYEDFFDLFFGRGAPRTRIREREARSVGSGFIFDREGHILTNYHVVEGADAFASVTLPDGRNLDCSLVGVDPISDLAVLKAQGSDFPYVPFGESNDLLIGEWVIAIGNPFGLLMNDPQPSVSVGVISAKDRRVNPEAGPDNRLYQGMIQTDAAINPGNSGGPLVNAAGYVVGINTMIFSQTGGNVGLGFAIPADRARRVTQEIVQYGRRRNPWAGFKVEDVRQMDPAVLRQVGAENASGAIVVSLMDGCPAQRAGLQLGDVITSINGKRIAQLQDVDFAIWELFVGDKAVVEVDRGGQPKQVAFTIQELTGAQPA